MLSEIALNCAIRIRRENVGTEKWPLTAEQGKDEITKWVADQIDAACWERCQPLVEAVLEAEETRKAGAVGVDHKSYGFSRAFASPAAKDWNNIVAEARKLKGG